MIYAAFLSIVLLGISILGRVDGPGARPPASCSPAAFTWAVFLKRAELIGMLSVGEHERHGALRLGLAGSAASGLARRFSRGALARACAASPAAGAEWNRARRPLAHGQPARPRPDSLLGSARALADHRYREARGTVAAFEATSTGASSPSGRSTAKEPPPQAAARPAPTRSPKRPAAAPPSRDSYWQAKALLADADRNQRLHGTRWSERDLQRFAAEDRKLLEGSRDPADHAHRGGYERSRFEALRGPEREQAEAEIEKGRKRDLQRLAVSTEVPGRIVGRGRAAAERIRQGTEGDAPQRRERLRALRRERRSGDHLHPRRNLSRGG